MKYLDLATRIAKSNTQAKSFLFGIVAERADGAVVISTNVRTQHPMPAAHAERRVLSKSGFGATLWIARIDRFGNWAIAKPCKNCQTYIKNKGVKKVFYTIGPNEYGVWKVDQELL